MKESSQLGKRRRSFFEDAQCRCHGHQDADEERSNFGNGTTGRSFLRSGPCNASPAAISMTFAPRNQLVICIASMMASAASQKKPNSAEEQKISAPWRSGSVISLSSSIASLGSDAWYKRQAVVGEEGFRTVPSFHRFSVHVKERH